MGTSMSYAQIRIALVVSQFNDDITHALQVGAIDQLLNKGVSRDRLSIFSVPGVVEIPLTAQRVAQTRRYDVIIALGAVIRGETTHYDYVCQQVSQGCQHVALSYDIPIIFSILTTETEAQAWDRAGGRHGHKGVDAANAALTMYDVLSSITAID